MGYMLAATTLIILPLGLILFHVSNLLGLIPVNIVWTGRVTSNHTMLILGLLSICLNAIIIFCTLVKINYLKSKTSHLIANTLMPFVFWWLAGNTVINLFSKSLFEVIAFTPILAILTFCCYKIKFVNKPFS